MGTRAGAIGRALEYFDGNGFRDQLSELVAIPSTSQDPGHEADVQRYLDEAISPWLERMGFTVVDPRQSAQRLRPDPDGRDDWRIRRAPTILTYGHGDTVRGLEDQWRAGLDPWRLTEEGDRWYGRGSADNKGQHALNLSALEAVLAERGGKLGFNLKLVLETSEERGSIGLREFVAAHKDLLEADVLIGSDGPRVMPDVPTDRYGHARHVPFRPGGRSAAWRRSFRPLGRIDHRSRGGADPCARHDHRSARQDPGARLAAAETGCRRACARCWRGAKLAAAARPRRSIRTGASRD